MIAPLPGEDSQVSLRPDRDTTDTTGALDWLDPKDVAADLAFLFDGDVRTGLDYTVENEGDTLVVTATDPTTHTAPRVFRFQAVTR